MFFLLFSFIMKYLKSKSQLAELLANGGAILVIFVDPNEFMPSKLLLNYIFSHGTTSKIDPLLFIWNIVDQEIYDRYQVLSFPQVSVLKGKEVLFSAIGYNRYGLWNLERRQMKQLRYCVSQQEWVNWLNNLIRA